MGLGEYKSRLASGQRTFTPMNGPQDQEIKDVINKTLSTPSAKPTSTPTTTTSTTSQAKPTITPSKTTTSTTSMTEPKFSTGASLKDIMSYRMKTNPPGGSTSTKPVSTTSTSSMSNIGSSSNSGIGGTTSTSSTTSTTPKFSINGPSK